MQDSWHKLSFEEKRTTSGNYYYKLTNSAEIKAILSDLREIDSLEETIDTIQKTSVGFTQTVGDIDLEQRAKNNLVAEYLKLEDKVITITKLLETFNYTQCANGFDVKLPPEISLSDLSKCTKDLNTVFSTCPLLANMDGTISFSAVDVGSVWLSFVVGGAAVSAVLTMIAILVDKALIIRSHYLTTKEQAEKIQSLKMSNEMLENAKRINEEIGECLLEKVCHELAEEYHISEAEDMKKLENAIELLANWMSKGMEVYASVQTASETKAVFPPVERQSLSASVIARLTEGNNKKVE